MEKVELIFIPSPLMGHVGQAVELAKLLINHFDHLTITVLMINFPIDPIGTDYISSISSSSSNNRIRFIHFPPIDLAISPFTGYKSPAGLRDMVIDHHKPLVRDYVIATRAAIATSSISSPPCRLAAFVVGMFCTSMIDVGNDLGLPSYVFFASNAAFLGLILHFQTLHDEHGQEIPKLGKSETDLSIPCFASPVPPSVLPFPLVDEHSWSTRLLHYARKYREAKGIILNTFAELEPHTLRSYDDKTPPVYAVGPLLKPEGPAPNSTDVLRWLDGQPDSSVVFLCFGSRGCFNADQVRQIAVALERSGCRFLWSLRRPPTMETGFTGDYKDPSEVLPDGFLERTDGIGKVIGWAPQTAVLAHPAVGGFVSHCGWNSILESLWHGVPIATWPLYAEQQLDAYQVVKEVGIGVEITLDYSLNRKSRMVTAEEIEKGIRKVMEDDSMVRAKVKEARDMGRKAVIKGGSSFTSLNRLVDDFM